MKNLRRLSRRAFLRQSAGFSAAGLAVPYVIPSGVLASEGRAAPSERIGIGMIGMGRQAHYSNVKAFLASPDTTVVAVCDVDGWRLDNAQRNVEEHYAKQQTSGTYKGCSVYRDFRELLARDDIDAVMISTPDHWHVPMAYAAAKAGKDIFCEKPLTLCIAEGRLLSDTVRECGRVFRTDSEFRSLPVFQRTCEMVRNGRIGNVHTIESGVPKGDIACDPQPEMPIPEELDYEMWQGPAPLAPYTVKRVHPPHDYGRPGWMRVRDYCEGMITNWGAHLNDIAQWGNGTDHTGPVEVEATGEYPTAGLWNVLLGFDVRYRYANGVQLHYRMDNRPHVRFIGDEGWIDADYGSRKITASPESILSAPTGPEEIRLPLLSEKTDFINAVKSRGRTLADAEVGHRTTSLCQLGHIAIQVGKKLQWDPDAEQFTNSDEANRLLTRPLRPPWQLPMG